MVGKAEEGDEDVELNLPTVGSEDDSTLTTFQGDGDAPVGSVFNKLMFAIKFGEPNFLLSDRVELRLQGALRPQPEPARREGRARG